MNEAKEQTPVSGIRVTGVITALLIVAAAATMSLRHVDQKTSVRAQPPIHRDTRQAAAAATAVQTIDQVPTAQSDVSAEVAPEPRSVELQATSSASRAKGMGTNLDVTSSGQHDPEQVATSASKGGPFPISKSVRSDCEGPSAGIGICVEVVRLLKAFAEEPRDLSWAPDMEERIRGFVRSERGKFTIRSLECRTSVCAIEVESTRGAYLGVDYQTQLDNGVEDSVASFGDEKDALGQDVTITLRLIERN